MGLAGKILLVVTGRHLSQHLKLLGKKKCISHISCNFLALKYLCSPLPELGNDAAGVDEAFTIKATDINDKKKICTPFLLLFSDWN